ncbi:MAG TPA: hypothetical protein VH593_26220 [Ktedonobacteraceae bacterium]
MSMRMNDQPRRDQDLWFEALIILLVVLMVWPAMLLGVVVRFLVKWKAPAPLLYWIGAGILGGVGAWFLYTHANTYPLLVTALSDVAPLAIHPSMITFTRFVRDALPLWERSLLLFPWCALLLELFGPKNLQARLLASERQRKASQEKKGRRAARKATSAPDQLHGHAILGALVDNPNE